MARRRRMYNTVRTDKLENEIAHYDAMGDFTAALALRRLARAIGAPLNHETIGRDTAKRRANYYTEGDWNKEPSEKAIEDCIAYAVQQAQQCGL